MRRAGGGPAGYIGGEHGTSQMMQPGGAGGLVVPGSMMLTKDHNDYYNMFIEVFMRNEKNIQGGDPKETVEFDDKLRALLLQVERQANLGHIFPEIV